MSISKLASQQVDALERFLEAREDYLAWKASQVQTDFDYASGWSSQAELQYNAAREQYVNAVGVELEIAVEKLIEERFEQEGEKRYERLSSQY